MKRAVALAFVSILPAVVAANVALAQGYGPEPAGDVAGAGGVGGAGGDGATAFTGSDLTTGLVVAVTLLTVGAIAILLTRRSERLS